MLTRIAARLALGLLLGLFRRCCSDPSFMLSLYIFFGWGGRRRMVYMDGVGGESEFGKSCVMGGEDGQVRARECQPVGSLGGFSFSPLPWSDVEGIGNIYMAL